MIFNKVIGIREINDNEVKVNVREAVRAIVIQENKILLVQSNRGDFKFPGGGVEKGESHEDGLIREVAEETGYLNCVVKEVLGIVIERHEDIYDQNAIFQMTSHYYLCELKGEQGPQQLDDYELEQQFTPRWVKIEDAIHQNREIVNTCEDYRWIHRETFVLENIQQILRVIRAVEMDN